MIAILRNGQQNTQPRYGRQYEVRISIQDSERTVLLKYPGKHFIIKYQKKMYSIRLTVDMYLSHLSF